ncbi:MAG: aldolase/citrate lyase family protein [bacterium]
MNLIERRMVDALIDLRENHHCVGVKAEFEAEGTRLEEALRLKEVVTKAGLDLTLKIGGCEAMRDIYECRTIGVNRIVAPMIESAFALKKFLNGVKLAVPNEERDQISMCVNIETYDGWKNFQAMLEMPESDQLDGVVVGRVDMTGSMGLCRDDINCSQILDITKDILQKAKTKALETAIGGGVSAASLPFFRALPEGSLDRYETRKVIFGCPGALEDNADKGILKAVGFELLWLKNKRDYYAVIASEDAQRIIMLEARYKKLIEEAGGKYQ